MTESNEADQYLLDQVRRGDQAGWSQFVQRYQGRLLAFARARVGRQAAEDLVQETFLAFVQSMHRFRLEASLETYLFTILRRKLVDAFRGRKLPVCSVHAAEESAGLPIAGSEPTGSWHIHQAEQDAALSTILGKALEQVLHRLREQRNLRDLRIIELLFYAQVRNREVAALCGVTENHVALIKHRCLEQIRLAVAQGRPAGKDLPDLRDSENAGRLLTDLWEQQRPTCPKRSTIGRYVLNTLEPDWHEYVDFHLNQLGCRFCRANLEDLRRDEQEQPGPLRERIFQSTVGFLRPAR